MILGIFGGLGQGKTLLAVYLAKRHHESGREIYANFKLPFAKPIENVIGLRDVEDCVVVFDDIIPWLDARLSYKHTYISWILNQSRKRKVSIIYTSQIETGIDLRLRHLTNFIIYTKEVAFPLFELKIFDQFGNLIDRFRILYSKEIYSLYDTYEIVEQRVRLRDLKKLFEVAGKKNIFAYLCKAKFNFSKNFSEVIFDLLKAEKIDLLEEIMLGQGYTLVYEDTSSTLPPEEIRNFNSARNSVKSKRSAPNLLRSKRILSGSS